MHVPNIKGIYVKASREDILKRKNWTYRFIGEVSLQNRVSLTYRFGHRSLHAGQASQCYGSTLPTYRFWQFALSLFNVSIKISKLFPLMNGVWFNVFCLLLKYHVHSTYVH